MTRETVLKKIKKKFKKYSVFVKMAGLDYYEFQKDFAREGATVSQGQITEMDQVCDNIPFTLSNKLTKEMILDLIDAFTNYGGVRKFVRDQHEIDPKCGYSEDPIFKILAAKKKTITPTAKKLLAHFGINQNANS